MLVKLQRKTLIISQIIGYALTLLIGATIIFLTIQFYYDIKPILLKQTNVFKTKTAVVSKSVSIFKTMKKDRIYFTKEELRDLRKQDFVKGIAKFKSASFKINAYTNESEDIPVFYTDLFFESIPDKYLDVKPEEWQWDEESGFIPIIIPENYLNLYNFGFAESQGLPVLSKNTITLFEFNIKVSGNYKSKTFNGQIVGFSNKINSILVPESFLEWANKEFGKGDNENKISRILVEFKDPSDKRILKYFKDNDYSINKDKLEFSKMVFFFKTALFFVLAIAVIIIILSVAFVLLSLNLILQKSKNTLINLYNIGYSYKRIAKFYRVLISLITIFSIVVSLIISNYIRQYYLSKISNLFEPTELYNITYIIGGVLVILLLVLYNIILIRNIKKIVTPQKDI